MMENFVIYALSESGSKFVCNAHGVDDAIEKTKSSGGGVMLIANTLPSNISELARAAADRCDVPSKSREWHNAYNQYIDTTACLEPLIINGNLTSVGKYAFPENTQG